MSTDERVAGSIFGLTALLWITGDGLQFSSTFELSGWRGIFGAEGVTDGAIAIASAIALFIIPSTAQRAEGSARVSLMTWEHAEKHVPWGVLLLFGGGFAIASGIERTGLANIMVAAISGTQDATPTVLIAVVGAVVCLMSELGSNTATASLTLPILAESAAVWNMDPQWLLIRPPWRQRSDSPCPWPVRCRPSYSVAGGSLCAEMVRIGIWMDLIGVVLLTLFFGWL